MKNNKQLYESIMKDVSKIVKKHLNEQDSFDIYELFDEYGTNIICIKDFNIHAQGVLITHITLSEDDEIQFWSGDPESKFTDEIIITGSERRRVLEEILEYM